MIIISLLLLLMLNYLKKSCFDYFLFDDFFFNKMVNVKVSYDLKL